jgi:HEPN domain-containing protein
MRNPDLAADHVRRAAVRLRALDVLFDSSSWADVVRESQEVVELALKGLLRACGVDPPRIHDVADVLEAERDRLPKDLMPHLERLTSVSRALRRDRELAFYGAEDLTPSSFYRENDAVIARDSARDVVSLVRPHVTGATVALRVTASAPDSSAGPKDV